MYLEITQKFYLDLFSFFLKKKKQKFKAKRQIRFSSHILRFSTRKTRILHRFAKTAAPLPTYDKFKLQGNFPITLEFGIINIELNLAI